MKNEELERRRSSAGAPPLFSVSLQLVDGEVSVGDMVEDGGVVGPWQLDEEPGAADWSRRTTIYAVFLDCLDCHGNALEIMSFILRKVNDKEFAASMVGNPLSLRSICVGPSTLAIRHFQACQLHRDDFSVNIVETPHFHLASPRWDKHDWMFSVLTTEIGYLQRFVQTPKIHLRWQ